MGKIAALQQSYTLSLRWSDVYSSLNGLQQLNLEMLGFVKGLFMRMAVLIMLAALKESNAIRFLHDFDGNNSLIKYA